ncbi:MAG: isoamylase early set domain-containing protein [Cyclobacteriaceae bacterium]
MSVKKRYLKNKPVCKVTLSLPKSVADSAREVYIVGEFNDWDQMANPMQALKNGSFKSTLELPIGHTYQFRYLIDKDRWENEPGADQHISNDLTGDDNSVIVT